MDRIVNDCRCLKASWRGHGEHTDEDLGDGERRERPADPGGHAPREQAPDRGTSHEHREHVLAA